MIGNRRAWRIMACVIACPLMSGIADRPARAQDAAASLSASFRRAASRARGSLVSVRILDGLPSATPYFPARPGRFGPYPPVPPFADRPTDGESRTSFSGLVIDPDQGHILTVDPPTLGGSQLGASQLLVTFPDGSERLTSQLRRDPRSGLAVLVVDMRGLHPSRVQWAEPSKLEAGDWLIALGQPGVGDPSMSAGIFSTRRRGGGEELIETDAAITRVGAGGIVINLSGEVAGICKVGGRRADGFEGMGHAVPADRARRIADDLIRFGQVRRAYLGVTVQPPETAMGGRAGPSAGVRVASVAVGTPAAETGIRPGDVIQAVGHRPVNAPGDLQEAVEAVTIGEDVTLDVDRQGQRMEIKVRPRAAPAPMGAGRTPRPWTNFTPGLDPSRGGPVAPGPPPSAPVPPGVPLVPQEP
jgi:serine protease Do